ncbi:MULTISPECIES: YesL family protein [Neobacillus]|uniref:YesL family protein n=1 Tax=Neobacillus citreus TaxID=2833578 RepID=A0A942T5L1_9BACI|nr:YesL family protein [Neobacillus citreus]MCH6268984.1 YesL family protein [Neobacillus citreus]
MMLTGWKGKLNDFLEWAMRLAYVNLLWIGGSLLGLLAAGFFPATIAMFAVVRKWLQKDEEIKTASYFWKIYKSEMLKGNAFGYCWVILGLILYFDLSFFRSFSNLVSLIFTYVTFLIGAVYICSLLFAFPVYVHYDERVFQTVKNSVLLTLSRPLFAIVLAIAFYLPYYLVFRVPGMLPFYSGSLIAYCLLFVSLKIFDNLEQLEKD